MTPLDAPAPPPTLGRCSLHAPPDCSTAPTANVLPTGSLASRRLSRARGPRQTPQRAKPIAAWPTLEAIVFDMGDVLYDATVWRRWLLKLLGQMGLHTQYRTFYGVWDREYLNDVHCGRREYREAFEAFLLAAGLTRAQIDEVEAASQPRKRELERCVRPLPGVQRTLEQLRRRGLKLGVLSDCERGADALAEFLDRLGLGGQFQAVVSSFDLDSVKPAPQNYLAACRTLGVTVERAAFVGHDQEELDGAVSAGMRSIAFNAEPDAVADAVVERFTLLVDVAARWTGPTAAVAVG